MNNSFYFFMFAYLCLTPLSVVSGIAVWVSWIYVEPEYNEEGILTRGSHCSVRARTFLTFGCMIFWICTLLGLSLSESNDLIVFLQHHPMFLVTVFSLADFLLIASVVHAWKARGSGRWILRIATPIIAAASIGVLLLFSLLAFSDSSMSM
jgi:hypothetical protein